MRRVACGTCGDAELSSLLGPRLESWCVARVAANGNVRQPELFRFTTELCGTAIAITHRDAGICRVGDRDLSCGEYRSPRWGVAVRPWRAPISHVGDRGLSCRGPRSPTWGIVIRPWLCREVLRGDRHRRVVRPDPPRGGPRGVTWGIAMPQVGGREVSRGGSRSVQWGLGVSHWVCPVRPIGGRDPPHGRSRHAGHAGLQVAIPQVRPCDPPRTALGACASWSGWPRESEG